MEVILPLIFVIAMAEIIVSGTWQSFYFTKGVPIFKKSVRLTGPPKLSVDVMNDLFSGGLLEPLRFKKISPHETAFREALFSFRLISYTPVMRGLIRYDERSKELEVIGFVNWFVPIFILFFIAFASSIYGSDIQFDIMFTVFPFGFFALLFFIQFKRFTGVFKAISLHNAWQKKG